MDSSRSVSTPKKGKPRGRGRPPLNLKGAVFGRLTPKRPVRAGDGGLAWLCECACTASLPEADRKLVLVTVNNLRRGNTTSCGCAGGYGTFIPVLDTETGRVFGTITDAAATVGLSRQGLRGLLARGNGRFVYHAGDAR